MQACEFIRDRAQLEYVNLHAALQNWAFLLQMTLPTIIERGKIEVIFLERVRCGRSPTYCKARSCGVAPS
jgi:hypothetical protein